jgi:putative ABC transport system permease protein
MLGRTFLPDEDQEGKNQAVVLSYGLWQRRFGGDRSIVGRTIKLDGLPHTVIGVMDRKFNFPVSIEMWTPLTLTPADAQVRGHHYLQVAARLKPGVSIPQASAEVAMIARRIAGEHPDTNRGWSAEVIPFATSSPNNSPPITP